MKYIQIQTKPATKRMSSLQWSKKGWRTDPVKNSWIP